MRNVVALAVIGCLTALSEASAATEAGQMQAVIKSRLEARFPAIKIDSVAPSPWEGLYEVVTGGQIAYTNRDASLLFSGKILNTETKEDLTTQRWNQLNKIDFDSLPLDKAIKVVRGDGSRKLAVFADPLCPFCQELEQQMASMDNVAVYTFLFPLEGIHPGATARAQQIWCAQDRGYDWTEWMVKRQGPQPSADCDAQQLTAVKQIGEQLKINSTPTLYFADGHRVSGSISNEQMEREFAAASAHATKEK